MCSSAGTALGERNVSVSPWNGCVGLVMSALEVRGYSEEKGPRCGGKGGLEAGATNEGQLRETQGKAG